MGKRMERYVGKLSYGGYRRALESSNRVNGSEHPRTLTLINNLASLLISQGRHVEAQQLMNRSQTSAKKQMGPDAPETLTAANNLAVSLQEQGRYAEAELLFRLVLETSERTHGSEHEDTVAARVNLATVQRLKSAPAGDNTGDAGGRTCMIVNDIVIIDGKETKMPRRLCKTPPSTRWRPA